MAETQTERKAPRTAEQMEADFKKEQMARRWRETKRNALSAVAILSDGIRAAESTVEIDNAMRDCIATIDALIPHKNQGEAPKEG